MSFARFTDDCDVYVIEHCEDEKLVKALGELEKHCSFVKLLGSYPDSEG